MADEKENKESLSEKGDEIKNEVKEAQGADAEEQATVDAAEDLKQQLDQMSERYLRLMAEFDNFKKRVCRDYERLVETANEKVIGEMVEVRETFERALRSSESGDGCTGVVDGMKLIYAKFDSILTKNGLESFAEVGDTFDPQLHDAMMKVPNEKIPEDSIAEIYEKGYRLNGRVFKHAKVIVSSGSPAQKKN
ncbi:MAG: nucleotide exchange factor GrpE [Fibrobacter sp.]|nr:nucleotide exchange factor GrpE [Fibrobacter sp.]